MARYDLLIRRGNVGDGSGSEPHVADIAVKDCVAVGKVTGRGIEEVDARGCIVTTNA